MDWVTRRPISADPVRAGLALLTELVKEEESVGNKHSFNHSPAVMNAGLVIEDEANVGALLDLLAEDNFYVQFYSLRLLVALLKVKASAMQSLIVSAPLGIARIMDCVEDNGGNSREILRNETLLLLVELTRANQEVQKVVAFESAFERLITIIGNAGYSAGGIIVVDALTVLRNLLEGNHSNQTFFRETSCFQYLKPLIEIDPDQMRGLSDSACDIIAQSLSLISVLVSGTSPDARANASVAISLGFLTAAWTASAERVRSPKVRALALHLVGDLVSESPEGQAEIMGAGVPKGNFSRHADPALTQRSSLLHLVLVALYSGYFDERAASVYVLFAYLKGNPEGQLALASTLTPSPEALEGSAAQNSVHSVGRLLVTSLLSGGEATTPYGAPFSAESLPSGGAGLGSTTRSKLEEMSSALGAPPPSFESVVGPGQGPSLAAWFSGIILGRMLYENSDCKQLILNIPLELSPTGEPIGLLSRVIETLVASVHSSESGDSDSPDVIRPQVALLTLLNYWVSQAPPVVAKILASPDNVPFLVESVILPSAHPLRRGLCALLLGQCMLFAPGSGSEPDSHAMDAHAILQLIRHRIGVEQFTSALEGVSKSAAFSTAEQHPKSPSFSISPDEINTLLFFEHEFTRLFKALSTSLQGALSSGLNSPLVGEYGGSASSPRNSAADARELSQAKHKISSLKSANAQLKNANAQLQARVDELESAPPPPPVPAPGVPSNLLVELEEENLALKESIHDLRAQLRANATGISQVDPKELERVKAENASLRREMQDLMSASAQQQSSEGAEELAALRAAHEQLGLDHKNLNDQQDELFVYLGEMETQVNAFKERLDAHSIPYDDLLPENSGSEYSYSDDEGDGAAGDGGDGDGAAGDGGDGEAGAQTEEVASYADLL